MSHASRSIGFAAAFLAPLTALTAGCSGDLVANLTEERTGNISVIIINDTPYRAALTLGGYDALVRDPFGPVDVSQQRIEAKTSTTPITLTCTRNTAIGTDALVERMIRTDADDVSGFDDDAFGPVVNFSSAPADSEAAALPTVGTAEGLEVRLGVDYACGDELIFTLVEDSAASGGFRIEFRLLHATEENG